MDKDTVISVENVSKKYCKSLKRSMFYGAIDIGRNMLGLSSRSDQLRKDEFWALDDISFEVKRGDTLGIIGPNGSGKTTLLKLLNGIFWPDRGKITVRGRVGALIELGAGFHPLLTGRENIYINAAILGMTKKEVDEKFDEIIEFADIGDFIDTPVKFYSSGMFVRLGFAVAAHSEPDVLMVDEVLAVGDFLFQTKCFAKMKEFREKGKTMILVTHDMNTIQKQTERVIILHEGIFYSIDKPRNAVNKYVRLMSGVDNEYEIGNKLISGDKINEKYKKGYSLLLNNIEEDLCPFRRNYNKNELRYGKGFARIIDFKILNTHGVEITSVKSRDTILFQVKIKAYRFVESPAMGITLKTKDGIDIYGNSTFYKDITVPPLQKGQQLLIEFKIQVNLQFGDYYLSASVVEMTPNGVIPLDRRHDFVYITVLPSDRSSGLVNLGVEIKVFPIIK